jgi:hypothetical protein
MHKSFSVFLESRPNMKRLLFYLLLLATVGYPLQAEELDRITPSSLRQVVIDEAQLYSLYPMQLEVLDLSDVRLKFLSKEDAIGKVLEKEIALEAKELSEEQILTQAVALLQPRGVIARKGVYLLVLSKGPVKEGTRLKVKIDSKPYIVVLAAIRNKFYTLQYKTVKKTFSFNTVFKPQTSSAQAPQ